ncbi:hypothetical protein AB0392_11320 [Nonomuraea angiospora]|uniref:hypothetical protein n=1 Tax=Nonomuraea angiospora TaxID=46172 RepID=UPI00344CF44F
MAKRVWPVLAFVGVVVISAAMFGVLPDKVVGEFRDAGGIDDLPTFLVIAAAAIYLPRGLRYADRLLDRLRGVPSAYGAGAVAIIGSLVCLLPNDAFGLNGSEVQAQLSSALSIFALALLIFAVFRIQVRNERTAAHPAVLPAPDDLEERFTAMARQLSESAAAFALLQAEVAARAQAAQELAREAEENQRHAERSRTYAEDQKAALEAVERLVAARATPIVDAIERRSRRSQVIFLAVGAVLGTVLQLFAEQLFGSGKG